MNKAKNKISIKVQDHTRQAQKDYTELGALTPKKSHEKPHNAPVLPQHNANKRDKTGNKQP